MQQRSLGKGGNKIMVSAVKVSGLFPMVVFLGGGFESF